MNSANLQQAVYTRLNGFTGLTALLGTAGIRTRVIQETQPESNAPFPYVTIELPSIQPLDTKDENGGNSIIRCHVWSRSQSELIRRAVEDQIYDALQKHDLSITGANTIDCRFESSSEFEDPDGVTTHGIVDFRVTYFET